MRTFVGTLLLLFAVGCANSNYARQQDEKVNPQWKGGKGKNALVIVATADPAGRENLETQFAIEGVERGMTLEASHRYIAAFKDITKDSVMSLVKANGFDRVIVVRGVPKTLKKDEHSYASDYYSVIDSGLAYPSFYDYFGGMGTYVVFSPTDPPPSMTTFSELVVETAMYDSSDASLIWSSRTHITQSRMHGDAAKAYVHEIVGRMKSRTLL